MAADLDTEVRVFFDDEHLYVGMFARDSLARRGVRVRDLQRDFADGDIDAVAIALDPFGDRRTSMIFGATPDGTQRDLQVLDGGVADLAWDAIWRVRTSIADGGWYAEFAIPWSSLRYPGGGVWSVNFVRHIRRLNETTGWSPWPRGLTAFRLDYAGILKGVVPPGTCTRALLVQPYTLVRVREGAALPDAGLRGAGGGEVKWRASPGTVVDLTINTDFAHAEAIPKPLVNLTRFPSQPPEQRPFFLETSTLFSAGPPDDWCRSGPDGSH